MTKKQVEKKVVKVDKSRILPYSTSSTFSTSFTGFTLIEILIVIVLIGILSTIGLETFQNAQKKGRDAQRKSDLKQVQNALESYNNDKGGYPNSNADGKILVPSNTTVGCTTEEEFRAAYFGCDPNRVTGCTPENAAKYNAACDANGDGAINSSDTVARAGRVALVWGVSPFSTGGTLYIKKLPGDPAGTLQYCYKAATNGSKYQIFAKLENASDPQALATTVSCGGVSGYNFGVSSSNTSPTESI